MLLLSFREMTSVDICGFLTSASIPYSFCIGVFGFSVGKCLFSTFDSCSGEAPRSLIDLCWSEHSALVMEVAGLNSCCWPLLSSIPPPSHSFLLSSIFLLFLSPSFLSSLSFYISLIFKHLKGKESVCRFLLALLESLDLSLELLTTILSLWGKHARKMGQNQKKSRLEFSQIPRSDVSPDNLVVKSVPQPPKSSVLLELLEWDVVICSWRNSARKCSSLPLSRRLNAQETRTAKEQQVPLTSELSLQSRNWEFKKEEGICLLELFLMIDIIASLSGVGIT